MTNQARVIGFWTAVALVVGNMIGSGIFLLPSSLAPLGGGLALTGWGLSAGGSILLALVFARLARRRPAAGGPYAYSREAFGELPGFLVAWSYSISIWASLSAIAVACVGYLDPFIPGLVRSDGGAAWLAVGIVWTVVLINLRGVGLAGRVQVVTTALKVLPLVFVALAGVAAFEPSRFGFASVGAPAASSVFLAVTLTMWAFLGLESGTVPAGAVVDPDRTIPRATIAGTLIAAGVYMAATIGVMSLVPLDALATSPAPFADAARAVAGDPAARLVSLGAAISCLGALNGWTLLAGELPRAIAADGLFPPAFARISSRGVPSAGLVIAGSLTTALVLLNASLPVVDLFTFLALLSTLGTLIPYVFCSLATVVLDRDASRGAGLALPAGAFVFAVVAVAGAGVDTIYWGFLTLLAGLPVFVWVTRPRTGRGTA